MKKNLFLTFVCACFPGFGQMYYGYMRRGTSLALWFWGLVFFSALSGLGMLAILLPVIWAYSFFDTFNIRSLSPEQYAAFGDDFIPSREWANQVHLDRLFGGNLGKIVGWVLIIFGILIVYNTLFANLLWRLYDYAPFLAYFIEAIPPLFVAGVVILLGLYILRGKKPGFLRRGEDDFYDNSWQNGQAPPPPPSYGGPDQNATWDPRANAGPQPTWDYSNYTAGNAQDGNTAPAADTQPGTAETTPQQNAADTPEVTVEEEIVLTFEETVPDAEETAEKTEGNDPENAQEASSDEENEKEKEDDNDSKN